MSEKSKGDTSTRLGKIQNPLLSASLTGFSLDDFPNKPLLLPAAPPVVPTPPIITPSPSIPPGILHSREAKSLVTVGKTGNDDNDTESLDEINLNTSSEDNQTPVPIDGNANTNTNDSLLSQAASSFQALPSVASSVLSTFSKRIYSGSTSREFTPPPQPQPQPHQQQQDSQNANTFPEYNIQPAYTQQPPPPQQPQPPSQQSLASAVFPPPPAFYSSHVASHSAPQLPTASGGNFLESSNAQSSESLGSGPPPEPPKFFTPGEVPPAVQPAAVGDPAAHSNTYRLSAKKKLYAPIPGLSGGVQSGQPFVPPPLPPAAGAVDANNVSIAAPLPIDPPSQWQNTPAPFSYAAPDPYSQPLPVAQSKQEERKGGLFSFTNLVPSGVLQNISGLVQSAAGSLTQSKSDSTLLTTQASVPAPSAVAGGESFSINYFGGPEVNQPATSGSSLPPPVFYIPSSTESSTEQLPVQSTNFFAPTSQGPPLSPQSFQQQPPVPAQPPQLPSVPQPSSFFGGPPPSSASAGGGPPPIVESAEHHKQQQSAPPAPPPTFGFVRQPPKSKTPEIAKSATEVKTPFVPGPFLDPTITAGVVKPEQIDQGHQQQPQPAAFFAPPPQQSSFGGDISLFAPNVVSAPATQNFFNPFANQSAVAVDKAQESVGPASLARPTPLGGPSSFLEEAKPNVAGPSVGAPSFFSPDSHTAQTQISAPPLPLPVVSQVPPPAGGQTSFRLQKGTRLYKNPLTSAEIAPQNQPLGQGTLGAPQSGSAQISPQVFNPFGSTTQASSVPSYFIPNSSEPQSVALFAPSDTNTDTVFHPIETLPTDPASTEAVKLAPANPPAQLHAFEPFANSSEPSAKSEDLQLQADSPKPPAGLQEHILSAPIDFQEQIIEPVVTERPPEAVTEAVGTAGVELPVEELTADPLEKAVQELSITTATADSTKSQQEQQQSAANFLPPPPHSATVQGAANPYRRGSISSGSVAAPSPKAQPPLSLTSFFTPEASDTAAGQGEFNFFASQPCREPKEQAQQPSTANFFSSNLLAAELPQSDTPEQTASVDAQQPPPVDSTANPANFFCVPPNQATAPPEKPEQLPPPALAVFPPLPPTSFRNYAPPAVETSPESLLPAPAAAGVAPPIGFDTINSQAAGDHRSDTLNSFSNFFGQVSNLPEIKPSEETNSVATSFFDSFKSHGPVAAGPFAGPKESTTAKPTSTAIIDDEQQQQPSSVGGGGVVGGQASNEDQRIQNFFNNPPPQDNVAGVGDLNYDLVHSGLGVKDLNIRSLTPASNLVEPPSSACSEFSELNSSITSPQRVVSEPNLRKSGGFSSNTNTNTKTITNNTGSPVISGENIEASGQSTPTKHYEDLPEEILNELRMANILSSEKKNTNAMNTAYTPAVKHWFYKHQVGAKSVWTPFSHYDSALLETTLTEGDEAANLVAVEGGRYDVDIKERTKSPVYWEGPSIEVRRCSWFYKGTDSRYVPYTEEIADLLEAEYKKASETGQWHQKIMLSMGEQVVFHAPSIIVQFQHQPSSDAWSSTTQTASRPRVVKRDLDDFTIDQGESHRVDHLLLMVHGIGSACDLKLRPVAEVVDDFRNIAQQLVQSHYKNSTELGLVGRVEVLPISWHSHLHSLEMGIDEKLKSITLESIPKLRNFTNDTLLDVLFYTSPTYCQKIMNRVAAAMNQVYVKYRERHPDFNGGVSLAGHSLGSLILFDLLCHQNPIKEMEEQNMENPDVVESASTIMDDQNDKQASYMMGPAGTGQPYINYSQLIFQPKKFFALGSPIGMFVTIRGIDKLGLDFRLPTCPGFYNIFHPFDPVAYRIEALVNPDMSGIRPVLIPHHKGRKRMHLELKETMTRVGADLKQRFMDTFKNTMDSVNFLAGSSKAKTEAEQAMVEEVSKVLEMQKQLEEQQQQNDDNKLKSSQSQNSQNSQSSQASLIRPATSRTRSDSTSTNQSDGEMVELDIPLGKLNDNKRIDHVLQEAPLEFFNEYLFALSSHVCYWESEDTILFVMKEIYAGLGISPDSQVPQQTMSIERPNSRNSMSQSLLSPST